MLAGGPGRYLTRQKKRAEAVVRAVRERAIAAGITPPAANTVRARVRAVKAELAARRRDGARSAAVRRLAPAAGMTPLAERPMAVLQIDHTPVDLILVDEAYRKPVGRPWLRTMRTLIDEMTRPAALLRRGGYDRVTQIWREAGRRFHWSIGRLVPFETMLPERRELVLNITSLAASALFTGKLTAIEENASTVLRSPPRMDLPDLVSPRPPRCRWPRGAWWDERIAEARRDLQVAWSVRALLNMSAGRKERAEMDSYLEMIGVPVVRNPPDAHAA